MKHPITLTRETKIRPALSVVFNQLLYKLREMSYDITALSLGEAFFELPFYGFEKIDIESGFHYSDSRGVAVLRHKISELYKNSYNGTFDANSQIIITPGSKIAIYMAMLNVLQKGDKVAIFEPAWVSYREQLELCEAKYQFIPLVGETSPEIYINEDIRLVILNNPNNPAGYNIPKEVLERILQRCIDIGAYLLVDEAYSDFVDEKNFSSALSLGSSIENLIIVNSLSKNLGMSGWRIGYIISSKKFIDSLLRIQQNLITCTPTLLQLYVAKYLDDLIEITKPQIAEVVRKRRRVMNHLEKLGIETMGGDSTFYIFLNVNSLGVKHNVVLYCLNLLLNFDICVVPGLAYGLSTENYIRISVGTESEERIIESITTMQLAAKDLPTKEQIIELMKRLDLGEFDWDLWCPSL